MGMCRKKNNRRTIIHDRTTLREPSNPLHIGDPYGDPQDITQGQMIRNTAQNLIMQAAARSTRGRYPGRHLRGPWGYPYEGPIRSGHGSLHNTRHHDCQAQLLGHILPLDTWILGYLDTWILRWFASLPASTPITPNRNTGAEPVRPAGSTPSGRQPRRRK